MGFLWVGGHPGIDLTNTVVATDAGLVDLLPTWAAVTRWAAAAGLVHAPLDQCEGRQRHLEQAIALREGLRTLFDTRDPGPLDAALAGVAVRLTARGQQPVAAPVGAAAAAEVLVALAVTVADAARLPADRVRRCAGERCVLHFHDRTRPGRRRWCDMATCGNRAKQAALRARRTREGDRRTPDSTTS